MTVLVAYGTTGGSTAEIARWIAAELRDAGLAADVRPAADVDNLAGYTAIVLGGAMYAAGWHHDARQFAHRFAGQAGGRPVWLFGSGPLDSSADETDLPPVPQVVAAMRALDARGQVTFGGRLSAQARGWLGFLARRMERAGHTGDFRNPQRIRAWARGIATDISTAAGISTAAAPSAGDVRSVAAMPSAGDISSAGDVSSGAGNPSTAGRQSGDPGAGQR